MDLHFLNHTFYAFSITPNTVTTYNTLGSRCDVLKLEQTRVTSSFTKYTFM